MAIDDSVSRDPRITLLAELLGWDRRAVLGSLVGEVWPICYDTESEIVHFRLVDLATKQDGFASKMVDSGLAKWERGSTKIRIMGAHERIKYLVDKRDAGRVGGLKSAESRRSKSSGASMVAQATGNPPDSVPDPDRDSDLDQGSAPFTLAPTEPKKQKRRTAVSKVADGWAPDATAHRIAGELQLDIGREAQRFVDHSLAKGSTFVDWQAAFRTWLYNSRKFLDARTPGTGMTRAPAQPVKLAPSSAPPMSNFSTADFERFKKEGGG